VGAARRQFSNKDDRYTGHVRSNGLGQFGGANRREAIQKIAIAGCWLAILLAREPKGLLIGVSPILRPSPISYAIERKPGIICAKHLYRTGLDFLSRSADCEDRLLVVKPPH
jgi:hypothetical protein